MGSLSAGLRIQQAIHTCGQVLMAGLRLSSPSRQLLTCAVLELSRITRHKSQTYRKLSVLRSFHCTPGITDLAQLHVDWPLYLQSTLPGYEEELPVMIGKFLSGAGQVVLSTRLPQGSCRFSIRHVVSKRDRWAPQRQQIVRSGDTVLLYCHSLGIGPFANITRPPEEALPVMCIGSDNQIVLPVPEFTDHEDNYRSVSSYDNGTMPPADQEAYERMGIFTTDDVEMSRHDLVARGIISPVEARNEMSRFGKVTLSSKTVLQDPSKIKDAAMDQVRADAVHEAQDRCATAFRKMMADLGNEYKAVAEDEDLMTPTAAMLTVVFE